MENLKKQLQHLFNKPEWSTREKQWLLKYLEEADTEDLKMLMQEQFEKKQKTNLKDKAYTEKILTLIHKRIYIPKKSAL